VDPPVTDVQTDTRFLLANERTLLAWIRTALALVATGVGVHQFGTKVAGSTAIALLLLLAGVASAVTGTVRFRAADRAIRAGRVPPSGRMPTVLAAAITVIGVLMLVSVAVDALG
jgi:inner membrane protein YidH